MISEKLFKQHLVWQTGENALYPYKIFVDGSEYFIRLNDWPEEPMYSLLDSNRKLLANMDGWPRVWQKPDELE